MNEITRIHLARVAYDIELGAKKELDEYLKAIKAVLNNDDTLMEVESRMGEILQEHDVKPGGVITAKDVSVIREKLGEPSEFGDEDSEEAISETPAPRRLLRDMEHKQIAGVAAGVAAYFGTDVVIVRLVFVILALINGLGLLLYLVLWAIMPPARTLSERLSLRGQTARLDAYKDYEGNTASTSAPSWLLALGRWVLGLGILFVGWAPVIMGTIGTIVTFSHSGYRLFPSSGFDWAVVVAAWAGALAFSVFMTTAGLAILRWNFTRIKWPLIISGVLVLLAGTVIAAVGPLAANDYGDRARDLRCQQIQDSRYRDQFCGDQSFEVESL